MACKKAAVSIVGTAAFFIGFNRPRDKSGKKRKEVKATRNK